MNSDLDTVLPAGAGAGGEGSEQQGKDASIGVVACMRAHTWVAGSGQGQIMRITTSP